MAEPEFKALRDAERGRTPADPRVEAAARELNEAIYEHEARELGDDAARDVIRRLIPLLEAPPDPHRERLERENEALLAIYHACNCLVGQADADSTVATVLTPALVAFERLHESIPDERSTE